MLKSALKKCVLQESHNKHRVTFCKTVVIFGYPSSSDFSEDELQGSEEVLELQDTINDNSDLSCPDASDLYDGSISPEKPEDFLVHKVVYSDCEEFSADGNLQDVKNGDIDSDDILYYPSESETELQEFIVHCVNKLEEKEGNSCVIVPDDDYKSIHSSEEHKVAKVNIRELSIENIEQHNKLTRDKMHVDTQVSNTYALLNSDVMLSPPLQELGIEHLICPQSDKWFWNLDISPLNSVQETDSGSNISSEDTMIMMTSEECEKNEQHIQESLQKFESIKRLKGSKESTEEELAPFKMENKFNNEFVARSPLMSECPADGQAAKKDGPCVKKVTSLLASFDLSEDSLQIQDSAENVQSLEETEVKNAALENVEIIPKLKDSQYTDDLSRSCIGCTNQFDAASCSNSVVSLDDSLSLVQIPKDVREWKIALKEYELSAEGGETTGSSNLSIETDYSSVQALKCISLDSDATNLDKNSASLSDCKSDELESFVDQCSERIERIKKRYSISENSLWSPRRGIRHRFGSTAQILQQMQIDGHSSFPNHHYSWPCYSPVRAEVENHYLPHSSADLLPSDFSDFSSEMCYKPERMFELNLLGGGSNSGGSSTENVCVNSELNANNSHSLSPSFLVTFHERGVPEGSSPPQVSTESLCETKNDRRSVSVLTDSVIYYSMKV